MSEVQSSADKLRIGSAACRISFTWFGVRKTLSSDQKAEAAEAFGASGEFLSAGKRLVDTKNPAWKAVSSVRSRARAYWVGATLPFPEAGIRLLRRSDIEAFSEKMTEFREALGVAVRELCSVYWDLRQDARARLGRLFCESDYPVSLDGAFGIEWDFPNAEPPDYLRQLNPAVYEEERARVAARFSEAVQLAEQAFASELAELVSHLRERLTDGPDGRKIFRDTAISGIMDFFERFRKLSVSDGTALDAVVSEARELVQGVSPGCLRESQSLRAHVAEELGKVADTLDSLVVTAPRRRIVGLVPESVAPAVVPASSDFFPVYSAEVVNAA